MELNLSKLDLDYLEALLIALRAHEGQEDKSGEAYFEHVYRVSQSKYLTTTEERIIALLHDVVEDTDYDLNAIYAKFGSSVGDAIFALSRQSGESYSQFIDRVSQNELATKVKIADLTDNMNLGRLKEITDEDLKRVKKYAKARSKLIGILEAKESSTN